MARGNPWKSVASALRTGEENPYFEHLRSRVDPEAHQQQLEREIVAEMANALGRSEQKVRVALARLAEAARELDAAPDDEARRARFEDLRQLALRARRDLLIHREAVGFRRNDHLESEYPVPPRRT